MNFSKKRSYIVGIDIGSSTLKIVGVDVSVKPTVRFSSLVALPEGADAQLIGEMIKTVAREKNLLLKDTVLTFSDDSIVYRRTELPHMPLSEIPDAIKWKEKDAVHIDLEKAALGFELLKEEQKEDGSKVMDMVFVAVSKEVMEGYINAVKDAGLNVVAVSMLPFGLENILNAERDEEPTKTIMVVDFGAKKTTFSIYKEKRLEFVRIIPLGSHGITQAMQEPIFTDEGEVQYTREEAEQIKKRLGIAYEETIAEKGVSSIQIISLMRPVLEQLLKEVRRSIEYYMHEYERVGEGMTIYITGGGSQLKDLDKYLSEEMSVPVKVMQLPKAIAFSPDAVAVGCISTILPLIGVCLEHNRKFNLLPHEYKVEKLEFLEKVSLRLISIVVVGVFLILFLLIKFRVDDYTNRLKILPYQKNIFSQVKELQDQASERDIFLKMVRGSEVDIEPVMKEISSIVPENLVLDAFNISNDKMMTLHGVVYGPRNSAERVLTKFMEEIEKSKRFRDAQLSSVQAATDSINEGAIFEITCSLELK